MAYKVRQTGGRVQDVLDDVEQKLDVATQQKNGYMSKEDKIKLDACVKFVRYENETELKSDKTQRNGTLGYESQSMKFFLYHSFTSEWMFLFQGNIGFPYSFSFNF